MTQATGPRPKPAVLIVLDGFGVAPENEGNAIRLAKTPTFSALTARYPVVTLKASSEEVGLSWGEMGNSEVGHLAIGSGRVIYQTLPRLNKSMAEGDFERNEAFATAFEQVKKSGGTLHVLGLMSAGKVHSFDEHAFGLIRAAKKAGIKDLAVHAVLDGRDTLYNAGIEFVKQLQGVLDEVKIGRIATLCGRYYAMDRDNRWERVERAYNAIALGQSDRSFDDAVTAIETTYREEIYDEEFPPTVLMNKGVAGAPVKPGDAVIFFNFRADRARQLTRAFVLPTFEKFTRAFIPDVTFVTMTEYEKGLPVHVAYPSERIEHCLAQTLSEAGLAQLHIAETEKYAHVTYFFNGMREEVFPREDRVLIPSPPVASYDLKPEMSAYEVTARVLTEIDADKYDVIIVNLANADMVGHSGHRDATIKSVEVTDECVGKIVEAVLGRDGLVLITADHGNAEEISNLQSGEIDKEHSTNPVPFWIVRRSLEGKSGLSGDVPNGDLALLPPVGILADVAPTLLTLLGLAVPPEMTGTNLAP